MENGSDVTFFIVLIFLIIIYFLPTLIANGNRKRNAEAIAILNLLLGWTVIGWLVALIWGCTKDAKPVTKEIIMKPKEKTIAQKIEELTELKNKGIITEEEYNIKKAKMIEEF